MQPKPNTETSIDFRATANALSHIAWTARPDGYIDHYNSAWYEYTGFDEAYGNESWIPLLHPDDVQRCLDRMTHSLQTATHYEIEYRLQDRSTPGAFRWFSGRAVPMKDRTGNVVKWFGTCIDIDAQKTTEQQLREKHEELTDYIERGSVGMHWVGPDGVIKWANESDYAPLGYTRDEYVSHHIAEFHADPETIDDILQRLSNNESLYNLEARLRCKDGSVRHVLINSNVRWENGAFKHTRCFTRDITERVLAAQAEAELQKQLAAIFSKTSDAILLADDHGRYVRANPAAEKMLGFSAAEVQTMSISDLVLSTTTSDGAGRLWAEFVHDGYQSGLVELKRKDGRAVTCRYNATANVLPGVHLSILTDITDLVKVETEKRNSEERYRLLFNSIDEGFTVVEVLFDANNNPYDYRFLEVNPSFVTHTGLENAVGKTIKEMVPNHEGHWFRMYGNVALTGQPVRTIDEAKALNRWYDVYAFRVGDAGSNTVGVLFTDITERRRAEVQLQESEQRFRALADDAPVQIWQANEHAQTTYANRAYLDFVGVRTMEEYGAIGWQDVIHPDDLKRTFETYTGAAARREPYAHEFRMKEARTGQYRWLLSQGTPRFTSEGTFVGYVGVNTDITERKEFVSALEQSVAERTAELKRRNEAFERNNRLLQQSNLELEQFAYVASHDLQEPIRKIQTFSGRLSERFESVLDETGVRYIEKISSSASRMHTLICDVLEYSRLSNDRERFAPTDLNAVLNNVLDDFEMVIERKSAAIKSDPLPTVQAVPLQMNQLFSNLLGNALKFSRDGVPPAIAIKCRSLEKREAVQRGFEADVPFCEIAVEDNGIGFHQEYADKAFEIFQRLNGRQQYEGTGIGLALCRCIAVNHHGGIWAQSAEGKGSTFYIVLPLVQPASDH